MSLGRLVLRSLAYYWRTGVVIVFGLAVATAVITGSLVIGDSVTGSLRETALSRLGSIDQALPASGHFREQLAADLIGEPSVSAATQRICPMLLSHGAARKPDTQAVVPDVAVLGIDTDFWSLYDLSQPPELSGRECAVNAALARDLGLTEGDYLLLTTHRQSAISSDTLFARRGKQDIAPSIRLQVKSVLPAGGAGDFRLDAQSTTPRNIFISRQWLASRLSKQGLVNVLLSASKPQARDRAADALTSALAESCTLADHRLKLVTNPKRNYLSLISDATVLTDAQIRAARQAAGDCHAQSAIASVYLATTIAHVDSRRGKQLSYAMIAGLEPLEPFVFREGTGETPGHEQVWLNTWAAEDLKAEVGDRLRLTYMMATEDGTYPTANIELEVGAIVEMHGPAADRELVPDFEGITDAIRVDEWDPPFPVDLSRITDRDEEYWDKYRATPKAFVSLLSTESIWHSSSPDADWVTSVRIAPPEGTSLSALQKAFTPALLRRIRPGQSRLAFRPVRELALEASRGTSDFGQLFLGLSMFLVLSGAGLGGMLLRLSIDRRASQAGIMLATGTPPKLVGRALFAEGAVLTVLGTLVGVPAGLLYAAGIISALGNWWSDALGATSSLWLHFTAGSLLVGAVSGLAIGLLTVAWSTRRLGRLQVLDLLAGQQAMAVSPARPRQRLAAISLVALLTVAGALGLLSICTDAIPSQAAFFGIGAALLCAALAAFSLILARALRITPASRSLLRLSLRNAAASSSRSLLVIGLLASATFIIVAVAANTRDFSQTDVTRKDSGTGGFELQATSSVPLPFDLGTPAGRANLGFSPEDEAAFEGVGVMSFLASPGEDISCLNLARPTYPRLLGVPPDMMLRGGFAMTPSYSFSGKPWGNLFGLPAADGAIPTFGDSGSVRWTLHSGLGQTYEMPGTDGTLTKLRFVGLLPGSIFQRELLVSEKNFRSLFPAITSPSYFLIDTPAGREQQVAQILRKNLGDMGLQVRTTREVLNEFMQVQNTYLAMFLALGSLGLLLGTVGLVTVLLRSAFERRRELALMLATGFCRPRLARLLLLENGGLLVAGLACGTVSALVAVAPHLASAESQMNWQVLIGVLVGILLFGLVSCVIAVHSAVRGTVISALRQE